MQNINDKTGSTGDNSLSLQKSRQAMVQLENLCTIFPVKGGILRRPYAWIRAVDEVSLEISKGETLGLVGESGCGKSTLGRTLLGLIPATRGKVLFNGLSLFDLPSDKLKLLRRDMQLIFQDPYASLDPRVKVGKAVRIALDIHNIGTLEERTEQVADMFKRVGLDPSYMNRFPHEFSGGQRQRIGIARSLILRPKFIVCDEPVSALDVSIQAQIINLLKDLQQDFSLTYLFIAHNLAVVENIADRVAVMYAGKIVEIASREELFKNPRHPYTQALIAAVPNPNPRDRDRQFTLKGELPDPYNLPAGCAFCTRCYLAESQCETNRPNLINIGNDHWVSCWLV